MRDRSYNLQILGMSEARWTRSGKLNINTGETILNSGRDDDNHYQFEVNDW